MALLVCAALMPGLSRAGQPPAAERDLTEMTLEELMESEVVMAASRYEQKTLDAPVSVTIVTAAEIRRFGCETIGDVLRLVRGFYVTGDRNYTYAGIRGFQRPGDYNSRILLMLDGHRLNESLYGSGYIGTEQALDLELLERVEIIRGPGSSLYGTSAVLGIVNLVTRRPSAAPLTEASVEAGSYSTGMARLSHSDTTRQGLGWLASGSFSRSQGQRLFFEEFDDPATKNGWSDNDGDTFSRFFSRAVWKKLTFTAAQSRRTKEVPTASFSAVFGDVRAETVDSQQFLDVRFDHQSTTGGSVTARLSYDHYYYRGLYPYDYPPLTVYTDPSDGDWISAETTYRTHSLGRHRLTLGGEFSWNLEQRIRDYDVNPYFLYDDRKQDSVEGGAYAEDLITLTPKLQAQAGLRYDHYQSFGWTASPRLSLLLKPSENSRLKLIYGRAFRAPDFYELAYYRAQGALDPEEVSTLELVMEGYSGRSWKFSGSAFWLDITDLIDLTTNSSGQFLFQNLGGASSRGVEMDATRQWSAEAGIGLSTTWSVTRDDQSRSRLSNSPRYLAKLHAWAPLPRTPLAAALALHFTGNRRTPRGDVEPSSLVADLTLTTRELRGGWEISASVRNLTDTRYGDPGSLEHLQQVIYQNGRNYRLQVSKRF